MLDSGKLKPPLLAEYGRLNAKALRRAHEDMENKNVNGLPTMILTMNMERVLTQIDTNKRNVFHDGSPNESLSSA